MESDGKTMDIDSVIRTTIGKSPGLRSEKLLQKVIDKTGKSRSTIFDHLASLKLRMEIYDSGGRYWLEKPETKEKSILEKTFDYLEKRAKRKNKELREKEHQAIAPSMAYFRTRTDIPFYKALVEEHDTLYKNPAEIGKTNKTPTS